MGILTSLAAKLTLDTKGYRKGLQTAENKTGLFANNISKLGPQIATAFSVAAIVKFGSALADLNKDISNSTRAFERFGDGDLLDDLRDATGGMVSDLKLMQQAIQAVNLNLNASDLATFFKFATIRAAETGMEVDHLVESIVTGIGRESRLVLDNLGISLIALNKEIAKGGTFAEAATRLIKKVADESNTSVEQATKGTKEFSAAWENLVIEVAKGDLGKGFDDAARSLANLINMIVDRKAEIKEAFSFIFDDDFMMLIKSFTDDYEKLIKLLAKKPTKDFGLPILGEQEFVGPSQFADMKDLSVTLRTVKWLGDEIKRVKGLIEASFEKEPIDAFKLEIVSLQAELDYLMGKFTQLKEPEFIDANSVDGLILYRDSLIELRDALSAADWDVDNQTFIQLSSDIDELDLKIRKITDTLGLAAETFANTVIHLDIEPTIKKINELSRALEQLAEQGIVAVSEMLGEMIGGDVNALENFVGKIANLLKGFGSMLISFGISMKAMESLNPYVMIAAGAALVAIGAAMSVQKGKISNSAGGSAGGGSYSSGSAGGGEYDYNREIVMVARGNDLVAVLGNTNKQQQYLGGI